MAKMAVVEEPILRPIRTPIAASDGARARSTLILQGFPLWILLAGIFAFSLPTMFSVASISWAHERGAHGPIVLATGLWLLTRQWHEARTLAQPGSAWVTTFLLIPLLLLFMLSRITGIIEIEGFVMYAALLVVAYSVVGRRVLRLMWFPILYLAFMFPPPEMIVWAITQPMRIWISEMAVDLLYWLGYPVGNSGVTIHVAQYDLLVAAACAGLDSMISLTAIGLFYVYIRHNANWRYAALLMLVIVPAAILANFIRVMIIVFTTYYFGDAVAQGFLHNFAGITMFLIAVMVVFGIDGLGTTLRTRLDRSGSDYR